MPRRLIAILACLAVVLLGVSGVHAHLPGVAHEANGLVHEAGGVTHHAPHVVSVLAQDHAADHDDDGDMDIDPLVKAFGKLSLSAPAILFAFWLGAVVLAAREITSTVTWAPPLRPPRDRTHFLLPPSQAPPSLLV